MASAEFGDPRAGVVQLHDWGPVADNRLALSGRILNPAPRPFLGRWQLSSNSEEVRHDERVEIAPGGSREFRFECPIQDSRTSQLVFYGLGHRQPGAVVLRRFRCRSRDPGNSHGPISQSRHFPRGRRCRPIAEHAVDEADTVDRGAGRRRQNRASADADCPLPQYDCDADIDVQPLGPGKYQVECSLLEQGKSLVKKDGAL